MWTLGRGNHWNKDPEVEDQRVEWHYFKTETGDGGRSQNIQGFAVIIKSGTYSENSHSVLPVVIYCSIETRLEGIRRSCRRSLKSPVQISGKFVIVTKEINRKVCYSFIFQIKNMSKCSLTCIHQIWYYSISYSNNFLAFEEIGK